MPIPGPGPSISMTTIAGEFGGSVPHSLSEYYRGGGLVPNTPTNAAIPTSGTISMGNFYGSANRVAVNLTISGNTYNYDVYSNRGPTYSPGSSDITVTVNPGVTVGSTSTGAYAMLVPSSFSPGDTVRIVNNGVIQGMGGAGGNGGQATTGTPYPGAAGAAGGHALYVNRPTVVTNNGVLAGGGGGGGGGGGSSGNNAKLINYARGGGGGGGGAGFNGGGGGSGGGLIAPVGPEARAGNPGQAGTSPAGGGGGVGGQMPGAGIYNQAGAGGAGGGRGANGSGGQNAPSTPAGFTQASSGGGGGTAGRYITGNPFVTWPATGTRQGGAS